MRSRRAKIAGTLGPACEDRKTLIALLEAGMDCARLNFSHGTHDEHRARVKRARSAAQKVGLAFPILADLQGPRFRIGQLDGGRLDLVTGQGYVLRAGVDKSVEGDIPVGYKALAQDVRKGDRILIDDGQIELVVSRVRAERVWVEVVRGGLLTDRKGMNLPGVDLGVPALTPKDKRDLKCAVELDADWLAVSFVRRAADIHDVRKRLKRLGAAIPIMAKIERPEAVDDLDAILDAADGILIARGDLGVELPPERVPILQKQMIERANDIGKPVMTATQMLDSMRHNSRPTRAEASDVANAVLDGSGSLLLTAETAAGSYPVEAVAMMDRIINEAENASRTKHSPIPKGELSIAVATSLAACRAAHDVRARYLVVFTQSGFTAIQSGRFRASTPILAFTPDAKRARRLALHWGIHSAEFKRRGTIDQMLSALDKRLLRDDRVKRGDKVVVLMGTPLGVGGTTNLMEVRRVGVSPTKREVVELGRSGKNSKKG